VKQKIKIKAKKRWIAAPYPKGHKQKDAARKVKKLPVLRLALSIFTISISTLAVSMQ